MFSWNKTSLREFVVKRLHLLFLRVEYQLETRETSDGLNDQVGKEERPKSSDHASAKLNEDLNELDVVRKSFRAALSESC